MIVYVESNFLLQLALGQEQFEAATDVLELARSSSIDLVIPAFSLIEPQWTLTSRVGTRKRLLDEMKKEADQIQRSSARQSAVESLRAAIDRLSTLQAEDENAYENVLADVLAVARILPIDATVLGLMPFTQQRFDLEHFDAVILTSVLEDLKKQDFNRRKIFVTIDRSDFNKPDNGRALRQLGCDLLFSFGDAIQVLDRLVGVPRPLQDS